MAGGLEEAEGVCQMSMLLHKPYYVNKIRGQNVQKTVHMVNE